MPKMVQRVCKNRRCGAAFMARSADVNRGWARFCSKSCKASHQEARTGQYARHLHAVYQGRDGDENGGGLEESIDFEGGGFFDYKDVSGNTGHLDT